MQYLLNFLHIYENNIKVFQQSLFIQRLFQGKLLYELCDFNCRSEELCYSNYNSTFFSPFPPLPPPPSLLLILFISLFCPLLLLSLLSLFLFFFLLLPLTLLGLGNRTSFQTRDSNFRVTGQCMCVYAVLHYGFIDDELPF